MGRIEKRPHHVCILGCGRSGTSIFGEFFKHLPQYSYHSEPPFLDLAKYDYSKPVAFKVPRPISEAHVSTGLPFKMEELWEVLPEPRLVFWQVRHPLDTICSLRIGIAKNWGHHPRPADWRNWLKEPLLKRCAHHWNYINTKGYEQAIATTLVNRFEDMVGKTEDTARQICNDIGIDFELNREYIQPWIERVQDENNGKFVEAETSRPYSRSDHKKKIGRWEENLTAEEVRMVIPIIRKGAANFGYELPEI